MFSFNNTQYNNILSEIQQQIKSLSEDDLYYIYKSLFHCVDHTSLRDEDNAGYIEDFCKSAKITCSNPALGSMASICVYPEYVSAAREIVSSCGLMVAAVAGGFPTGQMPLPIKLQEVKFAVDAGADEIDFVIHRGNVLHGETNLLADEIASVRHICGSNVLLKVILETGELKEPSVIYHASMIAMQNGADFIKTSTGKSAVGATPEAAYTMLNAISDFQKKEGKLTGFKVSGGVSTLDDALLYYLMAKKILSFKEINNQIFRIGTSRLMGALEKILTY